MLTRDVRADTKVGICVATYRRPNSLRNLLQSLARLTFEHSATPSLFLVVVDNDSEGSAREVVESCRELLGWPVEYTVVPRANIALARNRCLEVALERGAEAVAFIDDDEIAEPRWLDSLIAAREEYGADVVFGPVLPRYAPGVADWIVEGRFFEPKRHADGTRLALGWTGNALVAARCFAEPELRFDTRFGSSGGEDTHFFMALARRGAKMVWTNDARAEELVPLSRARVRWMVLRAFRIGNVIVFCERALIPAWAWLPRRVAEALLRIFLGLLLLLAAVPRGRVPVVRALRTISHGLGSVAALAGYRHREYTAVHGS